MEKVNNKKRLHSFLMQDTIFGFSAALMTYFLSSYLAEFMEEKYISIVYIISNFLCIGGIFLFGVISRRVVFYKLTILSYIFSAILLFTQFFKFNNFFTVALFIIFGDVIGIFSSILVDFGIKKYSKAGEEGSSKAMQWTLINMMYLIGPLMAGFLIKKFNFNLLFLITGIVSIIPIIIFIKDFKKEKINIKQDNNIDFKKIRKDKNFIQICRVSFFVSIFYAFNTIYIPIHMNSDLNMSWEKIGLIISLTLIPFVVTEYPIGKLADKYLGEKEFLVIGMLITGITTTSMFFVKNWILFGILLFINSIGVSMIDLMREIYLNKKCSKNYISKLNFFKLIPQISWMICPILSSLIIFIFKDSKYAFLVFGLILFIFGTLEALKIKDTKVNFKIKSIEF